MYKLMNKKGYTLIEVICALSVLSIFLLTSISIQLNYISIKKYNKETYACSSYLEALKNNIMNKCTYSEIVTLQNNKKYFIRGESMNQDILRTQGIMSIISEQIPDKKPYVKIEKSQDKYVVNIKVTAYIKSNNREETLELEFLKGDY